MPTAKLDVCDIKFEAVYPDKIKVKRPTENTSRSSALFLKIALKLFARKVFGATFFQKGSKNPQHKLTPTALPLRIFRRL